MQLFKFPKNDKRYHWTNHVMRKMLYYGLTPDKVKRIMRNPKRSENGIAEDTIAVMQPSGSKTKPTEIWAMYASRPKSQQKVIITAWRYPGISPVRDEIPIPSDILEELRAEGII
ncbi:MAG: hypothetical protein A2568_00895 [Candidatus Yanofskybacteria bacterium RIFOXYD1_FULL_44_17]|uniref:Uncharacterized protein n=1 Tax=Candidatus Yanofskybacteria bacterium GW2011_GWE2_40_11 TaxID=1619033 RepID=A0A0G0TRL7_9BACT|nr:MAG: hypothetical protein UT69_C0007G0002 [Candidatus Yanofskybacteria bacterium GW2011_GWE1_40_10]KKR40512.1 MAG: hypothetical protein UT75_C0008G0034 [Candidatus Yanofskybacteria bacterium GW2011_GWE2_40_11]OGN35488.1 MAG: hypothetical protein A2207_01990 [Candidatus Yanofskybacteria bacterium RIFOXYA1_FULL_44_17]OGN36806.1 MAG: hypothetical protein A2241_03385 [Candidatus Yanofskybacteria bacterium RIFOXYA2_FULL_45_28]OGN38131.1 MAG: hypothetical protein A2371_01775 [Candidatus Yanofskyba